MSPEEAASAALEVLLDAKLLLPAARRFKKPKPGRKKLVKWPRTLEPTRVKGGLATRGSRTPQQRIFPCSPHSRY
jgi:hypothetical protein